LNHLQLPDSIALDYAAIASLESSENLRKIKQLAKEFVEVASEPNNRSVKFSNGENFLSDMNSVETCSAAVHVIWYWIDYHINHTGDKARVVKDVAKWFGGFGRGTLLQQRGRLGYVSVLPLTYLHLLVTVIVRSTNEERVRLKELWAGLAARGFLLDEGSKRAVISNLEEIGVLEAKSDSGDARYVRAPF